MLNDLEWRSFGGRWQRLMGHQLWHLLEGRHLVVQVVYRRFTLQENESHRPETSKIARLTKITYIGTLEIEPEFVSGINGLIKKENLCRTLDTVVSLDFGQGLVETLLNSIDEILNCGLFFHFDRISSWFALRAGNMTNHI